MNDNQSRREFLQKASMVTSGLFLGSHFPDLKALAANSNSPSDSVRLGIIGVGSRGQYLFKLLNQIPGIEVIIVDDANQFHTSNSLEFKKEI